jgi:glutamyl-tRNA(Gln) amidotransferase subunit D
LIHKGVKVRKLHTSRRDAFKSVNSKAVARVDINGKIEFLSNYDKPDKNRKLNIKTGFEKKVGILKIRPGISNKELEFYKNYKGLVIEGTGLGHMPVTVLDKYTKEHKLILNSLKKLCKNMVVVMCSQCIFGRVNMHVYSSGRDILNAGVLSGENMLSETAFVKLAWLLGNYKDKKKVRMLMRENLVGEISERVGVEFLE